VKSKKSLVFSELISELPVESSDIMPEEYPIKGDIFLIASSDPWYGDILVYLQTLKCPTSSSHMMSVDEFDIRHETILYSMTLCIVEAWIAFLMMPYP
jgi:hypothetical protein